MYLSIKHYFSETKMRKGLSYSNTEELLFLIVHEVPHPIKQDCVLYPIKQDVSSRAALNQMPTVVLHHSLHLNLMHEKCV